MLVIVIAAARWTVSRFAVPPSRAERLALGCIALFLLLMAEFGLCLGFGTCRSMHISQAGTRCQGQSIMRSLGSLPLFHFFIERWSPGERQSGRRRWAVRR